uniref:Vrille n=1 Tax=Lutzomyia longipalpis TaxID=7200 RepID=A0A0H4BLD2_LUTLO|nr:vrille [Lutzomyia longipalpis]
MHPDPGIIFSASPGVLRQRMMVAGFVERQQSCSPSNGEGPPMGHHQMHSPRGHMEMYHEHTSSMSPRSPGADSYGQREPGGNQNYEIGSAAHLKRKELFTQRKQREFIPDNKKDESYWDRRRRNNEAAKRSREKRRFNDMVLEQRVVELTKENHVLKAQLDAIKDKYNICGESLVSVDQIMATLPNADQLLTITKRAKLMAYPNSPSRQPPPPESPPPELHAPPLFAHRHHTPPLHPALLQNPPGGDHSHDLHHPSNPPMHVYAPAPSYVHHQPTPAPHHPLPPAMSPEDPHHHTTREDALNLSRRPASPFDASSGSCASGTASGDDEHCCESSTVVAPPVVDIANSLPLKLRHKSHLGDKDAASALLALQHIKQEPSLRASPPWGDGEGSSDERDSGISLSGGHGEPWVRKMPPGTTTTLAVGVVGILDKEEENCHLKTQLKRLENEVASIKNMMILSNANGATAAAQ